MKQRMDYSEYGGAPLLGLDGVALVGHGRSNSKAVRNAIRFAAELAEQGLVEEIRSAMERDRSGEGDEVVCS
jgi:glycerol-3-phosphate acyltransferase PlsX